eukprot:2087238-Amphidinium_carterae.1
MGRRQWTRTRVWLRRSSRHPNLLKGQQFTALALYFNFYLISVAFGGLIGEVYSGAEARHPDQDSQGPWVSGQ